MSSLRERSTYAEAQNGAHAHGESFDAFLAQVDEQLVPRLVDEDFLGSARRVLLDELCERALLTEKDLEGGKVTLSSGRPAKYYIDGKRSLLTRRAFWAAGVLIAAKAQELDARAVGGLTIGADPLACGALTAGPGREAFLVRKTRKKHGLGNWIEGPRLQPGERCLIVDDVVTRGGSMVEAIEKARAEELLIVGVLCVLDRLEGGAATIREAAGPGVPFIALTDINELYPDRPTS